MHNCPDCGTLHEEPVVEEVPQETIEEVTEATVRVAEIEADKEIKIAKIEAGVTEDITESRIAELEGRIHGMEQVLNRLAPPEPEPPSAAPAVPEPVVVEPVQDDEMPPKAEHREPPKTKKSSSYFGF